jgi:hypothetical protein
MKDEIVDWRLSLGDRAPEGNLARSMKLDLKNVTHEECAAKQGHRISKRITLANRVRVWLVKNYRACFRKN